MWSPRRQPTVRRVWNSRSRCRCCWPRSPPGTTAAENTTLPPRLAPPGPGWPPSSIPTPRPQVSAPNPRSRQQPLLLRGRASRAANPLRRGPAVSRRRVISDRRDRGQYLSLTYTDRLIELGIIPSVGTVGDSLRQRPRRKRRRVLQNRTDPPTPTLAHRRAGRAGHLRMGLVVQPTPPSRSARLPATSRVRGRPTQCPCYLRASRPGPRNHIGTKPGVVHEDHLLIE